MSVTPTVEWFTLITLQLRTDPDSPRAPVVLWLLATLSIDLSAITCLPSPPLSVVLSYFAVVGQACVQTVAIFCIWVCCCKMVPKRTPRFSVRGCFSGLESATSILDIGVCVCLCIWKQVEIVCNPDSAEMTTACDAVQITGRQIPLLCVCACVCAHTRQHETKQSYSISQTRDQV